MPRNAASVYSLPAGNPVIPGTTITTTWANTTLDDIALALTNSLSTDGSTATVSLANKTLQNAVSLTLTTPLAIASGGTGASTAAGARTNLGVQPLDADLTAIAALATSGFPARIAADTWAMRFISGTANKITVSNQDGIAGNPTITIPDAVTLVTPTVTSSINLTGGQITFPSTQVPSAGANVLDDYEEGSWTPTLTFATPGNLAVTYNLRQAQYTKIGNLVNVTMRVQTATFTHTTASGVCQISGLPFSVVSNSACQSTCWTGITKAIYTDYSWNMVASSTTTNFICSASAAALSQPTATDMPTGGTVEFSSSGQYMV